MSLALLTAAIGGSAETASAQILVPGFNRVVGGVTVDAEGVAQNVSVADQRAWAQQLRQQVQGAPQRLQDEKGLRHVSLKRLAETVAAADREHKSVDEATMYLGGLTRIEYILLYPEQNDIVLAGPAEDWTVSEDGTVVGKKSKQPVLRLDDLITAFAELNCESPESLSVSIEPTAEGSRRLNELLGSVRLTGNQSPQRLEPAMREAFGPQQVLLTGVEADRHLAKVMFAADYQMKRIGMKLKASPVKGLPSYVDMLRHAAPPENQSRWWFSANYAPVERSNDSQAWRISGVGLKLQTEEDVVQADGSRLSGGKSNPLAEKWADAFTDSMEKLVVAEPAIGQLRGVMDLCVAAAIVRSHNLESLAGCDLSAFRQARLDMGQNATPAPQAVEPQCSFLKAGSSWIVTASGGVLIDPWSTAQTAVESESLTAVRQTVQPEGQESAIW